MRHARIKNISKDTFKEILEEAIKVSFNFHIDEKGTEKNPNWITRSKSDLTFEQAWDLIKDYSPHNVIIFRNESYINNNLNDYWEFGSCNIASNGYGEVFIFIDVSPKEAEKIFQKYDLEVEFYG